ncbi:hypothetical protein EDC04DRAFT_2597786 [Pisolithus marmoratus]|nr:hypothetical protein EDC04DRAFT_2597786 [Pisolithus marmoratus]
MHKFSTIMRVSHEQASPPMLLDGIHDHLWYDDAGNPFVCDANGVWIPHPGYAKTLISSTILPSTPALVKCQETSHIQPVLEPITKHALQHCDMNTGTPWVPSMSPAAFPGRNPTLVPLPHSCDDDLCVLHIIAEAQGQVPSPKVAGAHHPRKDGLAAAKSKRLKSKDKENSVSMKSKKHMRDIIDLDDDELPKAKWGHPQGAGNYTTSDTNALLDCVEEELPLVMVNFNKWASKNAHPERKMSSLETKFKQLIKTLKPTGMGVCPPEISHAHQIDELINEWAGTCNLDDSEFDKVAENASKLDTTELMNCLTNAFNPEVQRACDEEHMNCTFMTTQYLTVTQQLHDAQARNDKLHGQLFDLLEQLYDAYHECDVLQMKLEMMQGSSSNSAGMYHNLPKKKCQCYKWFADGGRSLTWLMDDEDDDDFGKGFEGHNNTGEHAKMDFECSSTPEVQ